MKTAVEWLIREFQEVGYISFATYEQAKEMEIKNVSNAYWAGGQDVLMTEKSCQEYINREFKKQ